MAIEKIHLTSESTVSTQKKLNNNFAEIETTIDGIQASIPTQPSDIGAASQSDLEALETRVGTAEGDIDTLESSKLDASKANVNVMTDTGITTSGDSVSLSKSYRNLSTEGTTTSSTTIPLADDDNAGLMSMSDYSQIRQNTADIATLKGQTVRIAYSEKPDPTATEIQTFVTAQGYEQSKWPQIAVVVTGTNYVWRYYANDGWVQQTDVVSKFTNAVAGIIQGSATDGKVYAETDGTGSVYGWNALKNRVSANESAIEGKQGTLTTAQLSAVNSGIDSTKVAQIATNTSDISGLQTAVGGKQDALDADQLAAVNSGIDSDKVAQIATNASNITTLQTTKYQKPVDGIPGTDLTAEVQASLALADSSLQPGDIVDNLTSTDASKVLSAKQGKALKDLIDNASVISNLSFTIDDNRWGTLVDGFYTLTIPSTLTPIACYNAVGEVVMAGLKHDASNIYVITDAKFAGMVNAY